MGEEMCCSFLSKPESIWSDQWFPTSVLQEILKLAISDYSVRGIVFFSPWIVKLKNDNSQYNHCLVWMNKNYTNFFCQIDNKSIFLLSNNILAISLCAPRDVKFENHWIRFIKAKGKLQSVCGKPSWKLVNLKARILGHLWLIWHHHNLLPRSLLWLRIEVRVHISQNPLPRLILVIVFPVRGTGTTFQEQKRKICIPLGWCSQLYEQIWVS